MSGVFCRFHVADWQFVELVGEDVSPGFQCRGSSLGRDGEGVVSGRLSCDVVRKVFDIILSSGCGQCV